MMFPGHSNILYLIHLNLIIPFRFFDKQFAEQSCIYDNPSLQIFYELLFPQTIYNTNNDAYWYLAKIITLALECKNWSIWNVIIVRVTQLDRAW